MGGCGSFESTGIFKAWADFSYLYSKNVQKMCGTLQSLQENIIYLQTFNLKSDCQGKNNHFLNKKSFQGIIFFLFLFYFLLYSFYDKRFVESCKVHTIPYGHKDLSSKKRSCLICRSYGGPYVDQCKIND